MKTALRCTTIAAVPAFAACVPLGSLSDHAGQAPTVTLPLAVAGIESLRQQFADLFEQELRAGGTTGRSDVRLHGVAPRADSDQFQAMSAAFAARAPSTSVLIVPGLFGDCVDTQSVPFGDGVVRKREHSLIGAYSRFEDLRLLGIRSLALPGRVASIANGRLVVSTIRSEAARPGVSRIDARSYS